MQESIEVRQVCQGRGRVPVGDGHLTQQLVRHSPSLEA